MTKIEEAREECKRLMLDHKENGINHTDEDIENVERLYEKAYKELEFDRNKSKLLLINIMEYVNYEETKNKKRIIIPNG
jgi:hypothetical protein